ncbi:unnamed protein product [Mytilus coruscus]|uniref:B box-type domain-containing protein n=1 Tax=Mytilus coruscus TaxID=42192 RepID=A0A6J8ETQ5_MYTCO|nr:unnamed protein product [Mytilus coruscus]
MATSTSVSCGICLKNGNDKAAIIWCPECESALCDTCRDRHDQSNKTINHKTMAVEELYQKVQIPIRSRNTQLGIAHKFTVKKSESINRLPAILAFCQLPNKDFVFVGGDGVFTICNNEGSLKDQFYLFTVRDITSIDNSTVAVSGGQFSVDPSANIIWKFIDKKLLMSPSKLTSDAYGNIYVLGEASYNVVYISADGKQSRQLLDREDGIENVAGIHYNKDRKILIIVNMSGSVIMCNCP